MKKINAEINGSSVILNVPETASEYREGARASGDSLLDNEGYLFEYDLAQRLEFENTGVPFELKVLFIVDIPNTSPKQGVVAEEATLLKDSCKIAGSFSSHTLAIELQKDFCDKHKIGIGSIVTIHSTGDEDE